MFGTALKTYTKQPEVYTFTQYHAGRCSFRRGYIKNPSKFRIFASAKEKQQWQETS